jgi:hypothetical protein
MEDGIYKGAYPVAVVNHGTISWFSQMTDPVLHVIAKAAGTFQDTHDLFFVVGDCEFVQSSHAAANTQKGLTGADVQQVSPLKVKPVQMIRS